MPKKRPSCNINAVTQRQHARSTTINCSQLILELNKLKSTPAQPATTDTKNNNTCNVDAVTKMPSSQRQRACSTTTNVSQLILELNKLKTTPAQPATTDKKKNNNNDVDKEAKLCDSVPFLPFEDLRKYDGQMDTFNRVKQRYILLKMQMEFGTLLTEAERMNELLKGTAERNKKIQSFINSQAAAAVKK